MSGGGASRSDLELLPRRTDLPIALVVATFYLLVSLTTEKITACNGFGDDGCAYGTWALDFPRYAFEGRLGSYAIQRSFPSLVAWAALKALHLPPTPPRVVAAFQAMNVVMVFVGTFTWLKIARILRIRATATLFGTLALFGTYGTLKFTTWYPVLGDLWGYALGFVCLYAYLTRRLFLIVPAALVGAFSWPSLFPPAVLLLFFWESRDEPTRAPLRLHHVVGIGAGVAWVLLALDLVRQRYWPPSVGPVETMPQLVRLSLLVTAGYWYFALRRLADYGAFYHPRLYWRALTSPAGALGITLLVLVQLFQKRASVPEIAGAETWFKFTVISTTWKPGIFLLAYVVYFGPMILVLLLRWRDVTSLLARHGAGLVAATVLGTVFGIDCEERHGYTFLALVMPFALKVLDDAIVDVRALTKLAVLSAVFSKLWITLPPYPTGTTWDYPAQTVFLSQGPWMSNMMYLLQGVVVVLIAIWMHRVLQQPDRALAAPS